MHVLLLLRGRRRHDPLLRRDQGGHGSSWGWSSDGSWWRTCSHRWAHGLVLTVLCLAGCRWRWGRLSRSGARWLCAARRRRNGSTLSSLRRRCELRGLLILLRLVCHWRLHGCYRGHVLGEGRHDSLRLARSSTACSLGQRRGRIIPTRNVPSLSSGDRSGRIALLGPSHGRRTDGSRSRSSLLTTVLTAVIVRRRGIGGGPRSVRSARRAIGVGRRIRVTRGGRTVLSRLTGLGRYIRTVRRGRR